MKILLLALALLSPLAQASSDWESLVANTLKKGTVTESDFGNTIALARKANELNVFFTIGFEADKKTPKVYTAVVEEWSKLENGNSVARQLIYWISKSGEPVVVARFNVEVDLEGKPVAREELAWGVEPTKDEIELWNGLLIIWAKEL